MLPLPYREWSIDTPSSADVARERLRALVDEGVLTGEVGERTFGLTRRITHRSSFLPVVDGELHSLHEGAEVRLELRPRWSVLGFLVFWFLAVAISAGRAVGPVTDGAPLDWENVMIPVGMMLVVWAVVMGGFLPEAHRTRRLLADALTAPEPG